MITSGGYAAIFFDKDEILKKFTPKYANIYADHSTIKFDPNKILDFLKRRVSGVLIYLGPGNSGRIFLEEKPMIIPKISKTGKVIRPKNNSLSSLIKPQFFKVSVSKDNSFMAFDEILDCLGA